VILRPVATLHGSQNNFARRVCTWFFRPDDVCQIDPAHRPARIAFHFEQRGAGVDRCGYRG
jgi:hypothetical protein